MELLHQDPLRILEPVGLHAASLATLSLERPTSEVNERLQALLGVDAGTLGALACWGPDPETANVGGHTIEARFVNIVRRQVCPECLAESLHHRAWWDVRALTACPRHGRPLVRRCEGCAGDLRWTGAGLAACGNPECHHDLRRSAPRPGRADLSGMHRASAGLVALFERSPDARLVGPDLGFGRAVEVAYTLGQFSRSDRLPKRTVRFLRSGADEVAAVMDAGWDALAAWPSGFHDVLAAMRGRAGQRGRRHGLAHEFGPFRRWLARVAPEPWALALREEFARHVAELGTVHLKRSSADLLGPSAAERRAVPVTVGARGLGVTPGTPRRLAESAGAFRVARSGTGAPALVDAAFVESVRRDRSAALTKAAAAKRLAVGRNALEDLIGRGLLRELPETQRPGPHLQFRAADVSSFVERLLAHVRPNAGRPLRPLALVVKPWGDIADACEAALAGRLAIRGIDASALGIAGLLFDPSEVRAALAAAPPACHTVREAAAELAVDEKNLRAWIEARLLETVPGQGLGVRGLRVPLPSIEAFRRSHVTATELSRQIGVRSYAVEQRLAALGLPSLVPTAVTALYRRADVTDEVLDCLRAKPNHVVSEEDLLAWMEAEFVTRADATPRSPSGRTGRNSAPGWCERVVGVLQPYKSDVAFRLEQGPRRRLESRQGAWLALGFREFASAFLMPWDTAKAVFSGDALARGRLCVPVQPDGRALDPALLRHQVWLGPPRPCRRLAPNPGQGERTG